MLTEELAWVAVMTYPRSERLAARSLEELGIEVYMPMMHGRDLRCKNAAEKPMFPCYIFARINKFQIYNARTASGVINLVTMNHSVCVVLQADIDRVHAFEDARRKVFIHDTNQLVKGAMATIQEGEFAGMTGRLVRGCKDGNFAVSIEVMNLSFVIHVRRDELKPASVKPTTEN